MATVQFDKVAKIYPDGTRAVNDLALEIGDGEFMVLVGPSGCGKTTALRMVAGLETISEGVLRIGERRVRQRRQSDEHRRSAYDRLPPGHARPIHRC